MKPKPGVCGVCGSAVVQPDQLTPSCHGWNNGHLFRDKLVKIRCMRHKEPDDPRDYDSNGNVITLALPGELTT